MTLGAIAVSILALGAFIFCLALAYAHSDEKATLLLVGAVISNATTAVGFWLGSSAGSQKKDEQLAVNQPKPKEN